LFLFFYIVHFFINTAKRLLHPLYRGLGFAVFFLQGRRALGQIWIGFELPYLSGVISVLVRGAPRARKEKSG
jgi:hypothetical protein